MSDKEFIIFLCNQIRNICGDGDEPDVDKISKELEARGIDTYELLGC